MQNESVAGRVVGSPAEELQRGFPPPDRSTRRRGCARQFWKGSGKLLDNEATDRDGRSPMYVEWPQVELVLVVQADKNAKSNAGRSTGVPRS